MRRALSVLARLLRALWKNLCRDETTDEEWLEQQW